MRTWVVVCLLLPWAGCIDEGAGAGGKTEPGSPTSTVDPNTLEGKLLLSPHIKIAGPATLQWQVENGSDDAPKYIATLAYFADAFKSSHHGISGSVKLIAAIRADDLAASTCGALPSSARSYYSPRDTVAAQALKNLSGTYGPGWYHFVVLTTDEGGFSISFDTAKEGKARALPARDPFIEARSARTSGGREVSLPGDAGNGSWLAWATHEIGQTTFDGGRDHSVSIDCQTAKAPSGGTAPGRNDRDVSVSAAGTSAKFEAKGSYKPTYAQLATTTSTLQAAWVSVRPVLG